MNLLLRIPLINTFPTIETIGLQPIMLNLLTMVRCFEGLSVVFLRLFEVVVHLLDICCAEIALFIKRRVRFDDFLTCNPTCTT